MYVQQLSPDIIFSVSTSQNRRHPDNIMTTAKTHATTNHFTRLVAASNIPIRGLLDHCQSSAT
jgi:hypothetical protein